MLTNFYGANGNENGHPQPIDPFDINGATFKPDIYLNKLLRERSLTELMDKETEMVRHIRSLDSDMQTLVYENYNKFISATDTIRKVNFLPCFNAFYFISFLYFAVVLFKDGVLCLEYSLRQWFLTQLKECSSVTKV